VTCRRQRRVGAPQSMGLTGDAVGEGVAEAGVAPVAPVLTAAGVGRRNARIEHGCHSLPPGGTYPL